jgi:putative nucleotidyltransferase with HDIG domain
MTKAKDPKLTQIQKFRMSGWKNSGVVRTLLFFLFVLLFYVAASSNWIQETYDIELNGTSEADIASPKKVENKAATLRARADASQGVQPVHSVLSMRNENLIERLFNKIEVVNADTQIVTEDKITILKAEFPEIFNEFFDTYILNNKDSYKESLLEEVQLRLLENEYRIPEETYFKLPRLSAQELSEMELVARSIVQKLMNDRMIDPQAARAKVPELVNASQLESKTAREVVQELVRFVLTPNRFYDEEATKEAKIKAEESTELVYIEKGDIIISAGERITDEKYALLQELELLKSGSNNLPKFGLSLVSIMLVFMLYMYIQQSKTTLSTNNVQFLMLLFIFLLTTISMMIVSWGQREGIPYFGLLAPVAMGSMLIAILMNTQIAYVSSILLSLVSSIVLSTNDTLFDFRYGFIAIVVCFISIFAINRASQRSSILRASLLVSVFGAITSIALLLIEDRYTASDFLYSIVFAFAGGIVTAVLVVGLLPFFELAFGILSPLRLVELSNPNHPLLRKLLTETPGTYHHSVMVGNLSEAAAEAIGANGLLCRVGSFYHDIGKTRRPSYFIENQNNIENPHDFIDPSLSKSIIIAHARDGVEMLQAHKIPKQICDIAEQHHGTTLLKFFYHKALKQQQESEETDKKITEEEFRYPGPKPQSREAAIVGIADSVEAAVRSLRNPTREQIETMVHKIMKDKLDDEQFNECDLTIKELETIGRTMNQTLVGIFHSRIEYPDGAGIKT